MSERDGVNTLERRHEIDAVDHGDYMNIGCIRVSSEAWECIKSKLP